MQHSQPLGDLIAIMAAVVLLAAVTNGIQHYLLQRTGTSVVLSARQRLIRHLLRLPVADFDKRRTGDLVSRIGTDTTLLYAVLTQGLVDAAGGVVTFIGALIGMLFFDPVLLGLTVLIILFAILVVGGLARRIRGASRRQQDAVGRLTAEVERSIGAVRTIRASGATERETEAVVGVAKDAWSAGLGVASASAPVVPVASLTLNLAFLVVIGVGGYQVAAGTTTIASLSAFLFFLFLLVMPLGTGFGAASSVASALGALGRITEVLDLPSETATDPADATLTGPANATAAPDAPAIAFEGVSFAYTGEDGTRIDVLHDVTFSVPRGTRTALVGPSGAGKSTMLALLERFYDVDAGAVRLGGVDIRRLPREVLRSQFGYVEQDAPALAGTIRENLVLAAPLATEADCLAALDAVNLRAAVLRHPRGPRRACRRGGRAALRRRAAAAGDRAGAARERPGAAARRVDLEPRRPQRAAAAGVAADRLGGPHGDRDRAPAVDRRGRRPDRGGRQRPHRGTGPARGAGRLLAPLPRARGEPAPGLKRRTHQASNRAVPEFSRDTPRIGGPRRRVAQLLRNGVMSAGGGPSWRPLLPRVTVLVEDGRRCIQPRCSRSRSCILPAMAPRRPAPDPRHLDAVMRRNGGLAPLRVLLESGFHRHEVAYLLKRGLLVRPRIGWYAAPSAPPEAFRAVRVGGLLGCVSAAVLLGIVTPDRQEAGCTSASLSTPRASDAAMIRSRARSRATRRTSAGIGNGGSVHRSDSSWTLPTPSCRWRPACPPPG